MASKIFNCISIILHPVFTVTLGMIIIISVLLPGSLSSQWILLAFCAGYSILMPLAFIGFARVLGYVDNLRMRSKRSRVFALVVNAISILRLRALAGQLARTIGDADICDGCGHNTGFCRLDGFFHSHQPSRHWLGRPDGTGVVPVVLASVDFAAAGRRCATGRTGRNGSHLSR